ncbi:Fe-S protein [Microbacterium sp.]|uniref:Fe-S protein n=1 Tax=Microbacterium sp. TaxID=51671 RepID=UPI002D77C7C8|nr:Fe-S protein [Microbacterium sp.]HET6301024.1 Fe-S protein [Microbacterium sp.]
MEYLRLIVVFIHITGFALLFGAWAVEVSSGRRQVTRLMNIGLAIAGLAGLVLAAPWGISYDLNYVKIGVKLVVLIVIGALMGIGQARARKGGDGKVNAGVFWTIGILTLLNAALGVIWR